MSSHSSSCSRQMLNLNCRQWFDAEQQSLGQSTATTPWQARRSLRRAELKCHLSYRLTHSQLSAAATGELGSTLQPSSVLRSTSTDEAASSGLCFCYFHFSPCHTSQSPQFGRNRGGSRQLWRESAAGSGEKRWLVHYYC